jgi:signal transduction histidine kinase
METNVQNARRTKTARTKRSIGAQDWIGLGLIAVGDTGAGLDPTKMDRIFDAFFTTKPEGIGMGLSICRSIVEGRGGCCVKI